MTEYHVEIALSNGDTVAFNTRNISGIGGQGKGNPQALLEYIAQTLSENSEVLADVMEKTGLQPSNISGMFNGVGKGLPIAIEAVQSRLDKLWDLCDFLSQPRLQRT